ncbi:MAG: hypothetical protein ACR2NR_05405 [Solirubrobacteraceae bacterium]
MTEELVVGTAVRDETENRRLIDDEALFEEARRLRRRRWTIRTAIVLVLVAIGAAVAGLTAAHGRAPTTRSDAATGALPTGALTSLRVAGALAVGPTGALYVADVARHRVLVRLSDGRFRVVAGTGVSGYSGDGGPALRAALSTVSELAFSPTGSLYLVDGGRVRVIDPHGAIHTVAGNGQPARHVDSGTPARTASLGTAHLNAGPSIAVAPDGQLYIATSIQLLRLIAHDTLISVRDAATNGPVHGDLDDLGHIAVDSHDNIDVSGVNGWSVWQVSPNGRAHEIGVGSGARQSGGDYSILQRAPDGAVYAQNGPTILRVTPHRLTTAFTIAKVRRQYFWPTYFAFGARGETYLDEIPGDGGFEANQQLIAIRDAHITLLWQERNRGSRDSFGPR